MSKIHLFIISIIVLLSNLSCGQTIEHTIEIKQSLFDEENLLRHIETLSSDSFEGRGTGTEGAKKARNYIINQFYSLNVSPLIADYEQPFQFVADVKNYKGINVLGVVKGTTHPKKYIVISAHYDHEGIKKGSIYNGADDNASGVSALFSFAEYFKKNPPKHSVIFAAFDGEELGLKGSEYFINHSIVSNNSIVANLNFDMISRSDKDELYAVGTSFNETFKSIVTNFKQINKVKLLTGHDSGIGRDNWVDLSDQAAFHDKGIPFLFFSVDDHADYHTPNDDFENIDPVFYTGAVEIIMGIFNKIDALQFIN